MMSGRHFGGQQVEAYIADGTERFKKSSEKKHDIEDDEDDENEESKRLDQFGAWLEQDTN
jgi:HIV Tat-specific factor 1